MFACQSNRLTAADAARSYSSNRPVWGENGKLDMTATVTQDWIDQQVYWRNVNDLINDSYPGDAIDDRWVIELPGDKS